MWIICPRFLINYASDMLKKNTDTIVDALKGEKQGALKYKHESKSNWMLYTLIGLFFIVGIIVMVIKLK